MKIKIDILESITSIRRIIAQYCLAFDTQDRALLKSIFHKDAVMLSGVESAAHGIDAIMATAEALWAKMPKMHHWVSEPIIDVESNQARAVTNSHAVVIDIDDGPLELSGRYTDRLVREDGQWLFAHRQAAGILYHGAQRPRLTGKADPMGLSLLPSDVQLDAATVAEALARRVEAMELADSALLARIADMRSKLAHKPGPAPIARLPYFCSGCPHNSSTKVPEGSHAFSGIGCHVLVMWMDRGTLKPTHMGGEGANWIGLSPYLEMPHIFQNLGDGTYAHSGLLAVRAAVQAKVNITYKILVNDAVAMTGGQPVEGGLGTREIARQLLAEDVAKCVVLTDDLDRTGQPVPGVVVRPRDELDMVQRELRDVEGVTVILYEQVCATEKRRRRKRGKMAAADTRVFINSDVCEGCGDCSVQSNCVSIKPKETTLGTKRQIDQSSCNVDLSCVKGFCPSFVIIEGATPKKPSLVGFDEGLFAALPNVDGPLVGGRQILITGVGGTGVVTIGAVLVMAAHMAGYGGANFNMTGLSQKNGAVLSHVRLFEHREAAFSAQVAAGQADLLLGCDIVAACSADAIKTFDPGRTKVVANGEAEVTGAFQLNRDFKLDQKDFARKLKKLTAEQAFVDATSIARSLLGDTIGANMFLVGFAYQRGWLPLPLAALRKAIELNGTAVAFNLKALDLGRLAAHRPEALPDLTVKPAPIETLDDIIADRVSRLGKYQNKPWADRYLDVVRSIRTREHAVRPGQTELTSAVAINLAKLMMYKDEYEVARLYSEGSWRKDLGGALEGGRGVKLYLAPPIISRVDPSSGRPKKRAFGPWIFRAFDLLKRLKRLRGTPFDIFGYTAERRAERTLIEEYIDDLREIAIGLTAEKHGVALDRAALPDAIRGFGPVKEAAMLDAAAKRLSLMAEFRAPAPASGSTTTRQPVAA